MFQFPKRVFLDAQDEYGGSLEDPGARLSGIINYLTHVMNET